MPSECRYELILPGPEAARFLTMTYPAYWPRLLGRATGSPLVGLAGYLDQAVGLALAELESPTSARLLSLLVAAPNRRQGLGTELIRRLEEELRGRGVGFVHAAYLQEKESTPGLEKIFDRAGWSPARPRMLMVRWGDAALPAFWAEPALRRQPLPAGYSFGLWIETTAEERAAVRAWMEAGVVPGYIDPFAQPEQLEPRFSLTLRHEGRLVGWLTTHQTAPAVLRFTGLFVRPDVPIKGLGLYLALEGLHRCAEADDHAPGGEVRFATYAGTALAGFWQRWLDLVPAVRATHTLGRGKRLLDEGTEVPEPPPSPRDFL